MKVSKIDINFDKRGIIMEIYVNLYMVLFLDSDEKWHDVLNNRENQVVCCNGSKNKENKG